MEPSIQPEDLLALYRIGVFPMADDDGGISLYSPDPRGILDLDAFRVPRSLRRVIKADVFQVRIDTAFEEVITACGDRLDTWLSKELIACYIALHRYGAAHSFEAWYGDELAGGLYGVAIGAAFFGESMFTRKTDASKVALVALVSFMKEHGMTLLDTQFVTPHLERFGAAWIRRTEYLRRLAAALDSPDRFTR
ncbi:MAG: leucyl/phenylalanyl-tRNA--protein transferase [Bacteroidota bacterium]|nr:leucyl/phenylalanyl-tRNA--protein transferase [Bacteroidota bacterium]